MFFFNDFLKFAFTSSFFVAAVFKTFQSYFKKTGIIFLAISLKPIW